MTRLRQDPRKRMPTNETGTVSSYAIRRVNPFLGVLQVIETADGRAASANGVVWDIQPLTRVQGGWGSLNSANERHVYSRYGMWSLKEGLVKWRLAPGVDGDEPRLRASALIDCVEERLVQLPFRLEDRHELWLFDQQDERPLALLTSTIPGNPLPSTTPKHWVASSGSDGSPGQRCYPAAGELEALVRRRAGFNSNRHWVTRKDDGTGVMERRDVPIEAEAFPVFLLTEEWPEMAQAELAAAFIEWTAPALLTLQHLQSSDRQRLEQSLRVQSQSVEHHWHLYPEIIDENRLKAARVQCRLQQVNEGSPP